MGNTNDDEFQLCANQNTSSYLISLDEMTNYHKTHPCAIEDVNNKKPCAIFLLK